MNRRSFLRAAGGAALPPPAPAFWSFPNGNVLWTVREGRRLGAFSIPVTTASPLIRLRGLRQKLTIGRKIG